MEEEAIRKNIADFIASSFHLSEFGDVLLFLFRRISSEFSFHLSGSWKFFTVQIQVEDK